MTNNERLRSADLIAYHKATGCPVMTAKAALMAMEPLLRSRVINAALNQSELSRLHDPIEDDPVLCERIRAAKEEAEFVAGPTATRGQCHRIWLEQERILAAQGITWFSPAMMNPWMVFD
jgi:hypothetical protein